MRVAGAGYRVPALNPYGRGDLERSPTCWRLSELPVDEEVGEGFVDKGVRTLLTL